MTMPDRIAAPLVAERRDNPGRHLELSADGSYDVGDADFSPAQPASKEEIMAGFVEAQANARASWKR
jgi:hypothetical protein